MIDEKKLQIVINNYFKDTYDTDANSSLASVSLREAYEDGFRMGVIKGQYIKSERMIGSWTYDCKDEYYGDWYICSVCGHSSIKHNYCPWCGARMENTNEKN